MDGFTKMILNSAYGKDGRYRILLKCTRCFGPLNGEFYQLRLPVAPICYGTDKNPDITMMYPHTVFESHRLCKSCYNKVVTLVSNLEQCERK